jgi:hypothetical protein
MEWSAYERVFGSILPHERIDAGLAQVSLLIAQTNSNGKRYTMRDFMPDWYRDLTADDELSRGMTMMRGLADAND